MRTVATKSQVEAVRRRIARFYECVNHGEFEKCYRSIDPRLLENPVSVTSLQYAQSMERFVAWCGHIDVQAIDLQLHLDEPSPLFGNRDFAIGKTTWHGRDGTERTFLERWVREGRRWYTLSTGFTVPDAPRNGAPRTR